MSLLKNLLIQTAYAGFPSDAFRRSHDIAGVALAQTDYQVKIKVLYGGDGTGTQGTRANVLNHTTHIGHYEAPPANPIIAEGAVADWDHGIREIGNVLYEPDDPNPNRVYKAFYTGMKQPDPSGCRKIGYAYSPDGVNWTKSLANPVITDPGPIITPSVWYEDPYVVKVGGTYYLYCERGGTDPPTSDDTVVVFQSLDCETWTAFGAETIAIPKGVALSWEDLLTGSPVVWVEDGTWYMIYEGIRAADNLAQIGLATSPDGIVWTKDPANPVASPSGKWSSLVGNDIAKVDGTYYLSIHGGYNESVWPLAIIKTGFATSTDLYTWTLPEDIMIYPDLTADPYNAIDHFMFYWDGGNNEWVSHYCDSRLSDAGWSGGLTNGIYRGYPRCTGDMFVCLNGRCRTDFGDVRFTDSLGNELDYWIQSQVDSEYAFFWVEIPTIPAAPASATIYIYYGNANATTTENGAATWIEYEDWESYAIGAVSPWGQFSQKAPALETAIIANNRAYKGTQSLYLDDDSAVNNNFIAWDYANKLAGGFRFLLAIYEDTDYGIGWGHGIDHYDNVPAKLVTVGSSVATVAPGVDDYYTAAWHQMFDFVEDVWHTYETCIVIGAGTWDFLYDDIRMPNRTVRAAVARLDYMEIMASGLAGEFEGNLGVCCVGKYVDPEPTHEAWGSEEGVAWPF